MESAHRTTNPIGKYHIGFTAQMVRLRIALVERIAHREQAAAPSTYGISRWRDVTLDGDKSLPLRHCRVSALTRLRPHERAYQSSPRLTPGRCRSAGNCGEPAGAHKIGVASCGTGSFM